MKRILLQGITSENHLTAVRHVLALDCPERVMISAAFMNKRGILLLSEALKPVAKQTIILAGIRNGITSSQGLEACLELGCAVYVVDTGSQQLIFHPKIYLSRNSTEARLVAGSANLTRAGLCDNIEASLLLDLKLNNRDDSNLICELEKQVDGMIEEYPKNVIRISSSSDIKMLLDTDRVIDEARARKSNESDSQNRHELDKVPLMKLKASRRPSASLEEMPNIDEAIPNQLAFIIPLQKALRQLDGWGTNDEICNRVTKIMGLSENQLRQRHKKQNISKVEKQIAFAKSRLTKGKYGKKTTEGVEGYRLTEKGMREDILNPKALWKD